MEEYIAVREFPARPDADPGPDPGLMSGVGVFETILVTGGVPFALSRHLRRLEAGAGRLGLPKVPRGVVEQALSELREQILRLESGRLRLTWTPGADHAGRLLVTLATYAPVTGPKVHLSRYLRNEASSITGIKSTSYAENLIALREAQEAGAHEAVLANTRGELSEGATSNVFLEIDGELLTPPLASGCLPGITRELCIEWAREEGVGLRETTIPIDVMNTTPHAALTSALKGIVPVRAIDGRSIEPGPLTMRLAGVFSRRRGLLSDP